MPTRNIIVALVAFAVLFSTLSLAEARPKQMFGRKKAAPTSEDKDKSSTSTSSTPSTPTPKVTLEEVQNKLYFDLIGMECAIQKEVKGEIVAECHTFPYLLTPVEYGEGASFKITPQLLKKFRGYGCFEAAVSKPELKGWESARFWSPLRNEKFEPQDQPIRMLVEFTVTSEGKVSSKPAPKESSLLTSKYGLEKGQIDNLPDSRLFIFERCSNSAKVEDGEVYSPSCFHKNQEKVVENLEGKSEPWAAHWVWWFGIIVVVLASRAIGKWCGFGAHALGWVRDYNRGKVSWMVGVLILIAFGALAYFTYPGTAALAAGGFLLGTEILKWALKK